jgi:hypothetical protein
MKTVLAWIAVVLLFGCAQIGGQPQAERPVLERKQLNEAGEVVGEVRVSLAAKLASRGCIGLDVSPEGAVSLILQQDGTSDWASIRALAAIVPETVAVAMVPVSAPIQALLQGLGDRPEMAPPDPTHGCAGILEVELEPE